MSVDNLDVDVLLDEYGITAADIRAGLFDNVEYTIFLVNWRDPTNSGIIVRNGLVGNFRSFANGLATGEARGLKQALSQTIIEAYSLTCRAQLGDERCKVNLAPYTLTGEVASVINRRRITITLDSGAPEPGDYTGGLLTLTSGANAGYQQEIKLDSAADVFGTIELFEPFPYEVQAGDTLTLTPGCNKIHQVVDGVAVGDCKNRYDNVVNFRGEPFIPGTAEILRGGSV
jgi:uncharacterized phage protein (TIGR02218 family)